MATYYKFKEAKDGIGGNIKHFIQQLYFCEMNNVTPCNITFNHKVNISIRSFLHP